MTTPSASAEADQVEGMLKELEGSAPGRDTPAPTMGRLKRLSYSHKALIDLIIEKPEMDQNWLAAQFGYTPGWISNILASDAFKAEMAARREEIIDPVLKATIRERFEALVIASQTKLMGMLQQDACPPQVALRCLELGAKGLGAGGYAPPPAPQQDRLAHLAERLVILHSQIRQRIVNGEVTEVRLEAGDAGGQMRADPDTLHGSVEGDLQLAGAAAASK